MRNLIIADQIDYVPKKIYTQTAPTCAAHAFFTCIMELIQNKYNGLEVEFDIDKGFEKMETWRKEWEKENVKTKTRLKAFMDLAKLEGWETLTGEKVYLRGSMSIKSKIRLGKIVEPLDHDEICYALQRYGCFPFTVQLYEGHDIDPPGDIINPIPEGAEKFTAWHSMLLRGFNRPNSLYKWHNSWGKNSIKHISFETFEQMFRYAYIPLGLTLE
jgi:hypothetical protein